MGPEVSFLPHSLEPAIPLFPEADGPMPSPSQVLKTIFISSHILLVLSPHVVRPNPCVNIFCARVRPTCPAPNISLDLITQLVVGDNFTPYIIFL